MLDIHQLALEVWWSLNPEETIPPTQAELKAVERYIPEAERQIKATQKEIQKLRRENVSHT